ncbi:hypothetical protein M407DRAFT_31099 [Tulasnella calospora MUT 4182]|uniref:DNA replication checkpoint mediator MRC1 domain-containing protein n=1 Tax=Tulasnella calospora MUT 4182 TaxID=1051891 RepID=A0A0C3LCP1_9AGAM|nr:hypothetical protein M407DRAFT_31099 [Tulasnella calospora MUT 4182]
MLSNDDEDDDGMLPDLAAQIKKEDELRKKERAQKELKEKKLLWAQQQRKVAEEKKRKAAAMLDDDDEEELEIEEAMADSQGQSLEIVESQHGQFNTGEQLRKAVVKDRLHAAISPFKPSSASKAPKEFRHPRKSMPTTDSFIEYMGKTDLLGVKSKPVAPKSRASMPMIKRPSTFGPVDLKSKLLQDVRLADAKIRRDRDEEWEGRGGHAGRKQQIEQAAKLKQIGGEKVLEEWAKKGIEVAEAVRAEVEYEDDEEADEEDEDYKPEEQEADAEMDEDEQQGENVPAKVERSRSSSQEPNTEDEDKENRVIEDKENVPPPRKARAALADKDDLFSPHQPSEAEDEPEDKENAPPPRAQDDAEDEVDDDDLFGLRPLKKHTARRIVADDEDEDEDSAVPSKDENIPPHRSPLKFNAFDDDDERLPRPQGLPFGGAGGKMLMFNSSAESLVDGGAEKEQTTGGVDDGFDMSDADAEIEGDGFSQLFALESKPAGFDALRRREPLDDMDLESQKLLPVMDLSTQEMQKDDAIFEQDQIVRAEIEREERQKTLRAQTKMYLNEDGFFTQTKPATQTPIDFPGDSQGFFTAPTTIGDDVLASQEQDAPLRRLRRGHVRQESEDSVLPSTILATAQTETKRDAFSVLMTAKPKEPKKKDKEKEKQMREFFQDQADESDEDKIIGFGDAREDENDEDEENDKHLEGLVDDKQIERSEVNEQAVIEKHQEQIAQDDAALEKYHLAATKGEYRGKKRDRGIGLSDDESDADDDANRRRRLALRKKRVVIGGDQLEDLANNERTSAFYKTYEEGIAVDEENDFGYIPSSEQPEPEEDAVEEDEDEEGADYEEEKGDEPTKSRIVNTTQLKKELLAAIERDEKPINPHDLGWVDRSLSNYEDDMDDEFSIKEINDSRKPAFRTFGQAEVDEESRRETIRLARLGDPKARTQPRREDKGATYGVSKAGTAITSHASKSKASSSSASSKAGPGNRPLTKGASLLQRVPTKQGGFDS